MGSCFTLWALAIVDQPLKPKGGTAHIDIGDF